MGKAASRVEHAASTIADGPGMAMMRCEAGNTFYVLYIERWVRLRSNAPGINNRNEVFGAKGSYFEDF